MSFWDVYRSNRMVLFQTKYWKTESPRRKSSENSPISGNGYLALIKATEMYLVLYRECIFQVIWINRLRSILSCCQRNKFSYASRWLSVHSIQEFSTFTFPWTWSRLPVENSGGSVCETARTQNFSGVFTCYLKYEMEKSAYGRFKRPRKSFTIKDTHKQSKLVLICSILAFRKRTKLLWRVSGGLGR